MFGSPVMGLVVLLYAVVGLFIGGFFLGMGWYCSSALMLRIETHIRNRAFERYMREHPELRGEEEA